MLTGYARGLYIRIQRLLGHIDLHMATRYVQDVSRQIRLFTCHSTTSNRKLLTYDMGIKAFGNTKNFLGLPGNSRYTVKA